LSDETWQDEINIEKEMVKINLFIISLILTTCIVLNRQDRQT